MNIKKNKPAPPHQSRYSPFTCDEAHFAFHCKVRRRHSTRGRYASVSRSYQAIKALNYIHSYIDRVYAISVCVQQSYTIHILNVVGRQHLTTIAHRENSVLSAKKLLYVVRFCCVLCMYVCVGWSIRGHPNIYKLFSHSKRFHYLLDMYACCEGTYIYMWLYKCTVHHIH